MVDYMLSHYIIVNGVDYGWITFFHCYMGRIKGGLHF